MKKFKRIKIPEPVEGMRVYSNIPVELTYQNFGSTWLCVLRGKSEDIDLVFNGLFNLCASNGDYQFFDHTQTVAVFWSDRKNMLRFFFNQFFGPRCNPEFTSLWKGQGKLVREAMRYAKSKVQDLRDNCHEQFVDFTNTFLPQIHAMGQISAERPDSDFKDAVLTHAFAVDKS
jgi:hypothetical protein